MRGKSRKWTFALLAALRIARRVYAAELIRSAPDVILANTSTVVAALKERTTTIPIVFAQVVDPVNSGFVDSLSHPGGNVTKFVSLDFGIGAKWLEILKQVAPQITRVGVLEMHRYPEEMVRWVQSRRPHRSSALN